MNISNWPIGKIMQLPDEVFGRRWPVITSRSIAAASTDEWMVKTRIPNRLVIWEMLMNAWVDYEDLNWMKFAFGSHEPANDAEFDAFERIFEGDLDNATEEGAIYMPKMQMVRMQMRMPEEPSGNRFCIQASNVSASNAMQILVTFVISSIPTEVPDWILSGQGRNL